MTHRDCDLSEVLGALQSDESGDLVRQMVAFLYQALIDVEATEAVEVERGERAHDPTKRLTAATGLDHGRRRATEDSQTA